MLCFLLLIISMLNSFIVFKYLIVCFTLISYLEAQLSPLQINNYDIFLYLNQIATNTYQIVINAGYTDIVDLNVCFQEVEVIIPSSQQTCYLQSTSPAYKCVRLYSKLSPTLIQLWLFQSFNFTIGSNLTTTNQNITTNSNTLQQVLLMTDVLNPNKIYHMLTAWSKNSLLNNQWKQSFAHTYASQSYIDTLITQRNVFCTYYKDKIALIFQGGVIRSSSSLFFVGILTIDLNSENFSMWGGYSFSADHSGRDMIGYQSVKGQLFDLYSIYASAPFEDTQNNVKGSDDVTTICQSSTGDIIYPQNNYHFIQFYRPYDTLDIHGDQIIRKKINNKFCFIAYFTTDPTALPKPTSKNFMHQIVDCHLPNIELSNFWLFYYFYLMSFIMMIFIF